MCIRDRFSAYIGVYGDAENDEYQWSYKSFWKDDKYSVCLLYTSLVGAAVTYKLQGNQGVVSDINGAYEIKPVSYTHLNGK